MSSVHDDDEGGLATQRAAPQGSGDDREEKDDLRKGARVQLFAHAARVAHPAGLAVTTNLFGAEHWGLFVAGQAAIELTSRVALFGYDRAVVYWIPREGSEPVLRPAFLRIALASLPLMALGFLWVAASLAGMKEVDPAPWQIMTLALMPRSLIELCAYAAAGVRRMEILVIVRDVVVQLAFFASAWVAYGLGATEVGLAWAYVAGQWISLGVALVWCTRLLPKDAWGPWSLGPLPKRFRVYAREMWGADLATATLSRVDPLVLAVFASPTVVGLYGIALQFGNTVRSLRGAFEPVVTAVASGLSSQLNHARLRESLTYATRLVLSFQLLPTALTVFLGPLLLPLFGEGFGQSYVPAVVLCVGWTLHGSVGLAGPVVMGFGRSGWTMLTAVGTLAGLLLLLYFLVPPFGATGAASAVAIAFAAQGLVHQAQARILVGQALFRRDIYITLRAAGTATLASGLSYALLAWLGHLLAAQVAGFAVFTAVLLPSVIQNLREPKPGLRG